MNTQKWLKKLFASLIQGGSHAGGAYLGLAVAHAADVDIPSINLKGLGIIVLTSGLLKLFNFLDANPLPPDEDPPKFTPSGGLAMAAILIFGLSGCATQHTGTTPEETAHNVASWVAQRQGFIENAVAAITQIAVYASDKDTIERTNTLLMIHGIAININALIANGNVDAESIRNAFKINESYFTPVLNAVVPIIQNEIITFKENGYGDATIEILKAVSKGISDGSAK